MYLKDKDKIFFFNPSPLCYWPAQGLGGPSLGAGWGMSGDCCRCFWRLRLSALVAAKSRLYEGGFGRGQLVRKLSTLIPGLPLLVTLGVCVLL